MTLAGVDSPMLAFSVIPSPAMPPPRRPSPAEDARRLVRHGLADVLDWLGEPAGPRPGELIHTIIRAGGVFLCHPDSVASMKGAPR